MTTYEITISNRPILYLNAESDNNALLLDIEKAVKKIMEETYCNIYPLKEAEND